MRTFFVIITLLYTAYFAKTLVLPVFVAAFLSLSTAPIARTIQSLFIPRAIASAITVIIVISIFVLLAVTISDPLQNWIARIPSATIDISNELEEIAQPLDDFVAGSPAANRSAYDQIIGSAASKMMGLVAQSTPGLIAEILATFVLMYFFLAYGNGILRSLVEIRDTFKDKKIAVEIVRNIQTEISYYLLVIFVINCLLGACVGVTLWLIGVQDPVLWGTLVVALNFAPYIGPFIMSLILIFVGIVEYDSIFLIFTPVTIYLFFNLLECQFITPTALGARLKLNPMIVLVWLFVWGWIWGAAGFLIGVPMLVCLKILAQRMGVFGDWIHLLEKNINSNE